MNKSKTTLALIVSAAAIIFSLPWAYFFYRIIIDDGWPSLFVTLIHAAWIVVPIIVAIYNLIKPKKILMIFLIVFNLLDIAGLIFLLTTAKNGW
jgi:hypothetical protein